ncbi:helix-turn-helix domain-containing protein, partial [Microvirga massiliensis]|uniref:helix-turn-helix domain-containing protein n=1 Tax=Microvirga massiliensis TaxID=1033741 RepID=UPI001AEBCF96
RAAALRRRHGNTVPGRGTSSVGSTVSAEEAARLLGIAHGAVDERRRAGILPPIREGSDWRYPACQFPAG